jgi:Tfp pilus assembly protein PilN
VKAVNLIPADAHAAGGRFKVKLAPPTYALLGLLVAGIVLMTAYVLAGNKVASSQAQLTTLRAEVAQAQSRAAQLGSYGKFASLAQTRVGAVRGIAATRFDWHTALANLAKVVPANTTLSSVTGSVVPGASPGGGSGGSSPLRTDITAPALELAGCSASQDDVARLISRLRVMSGVTNVALGSSQKATQAAGSGSSSGAGGCNADAPSFDVIVFYKSIPGAGATGATSLGSATTTGTTGGAQ